MGGAPRETEGEFEFRPFRAWSSVAILLIFSLLSILDRQIISLQVDPIRRSLGLSDTELGLLQGFAFALLYALAGLPLGWAIDRYPRKILLHAGITLWSLSAAATGVARSFWQMFAARTSVGIGEAVLAPAALSLISDLFPKERVATPLGIYSAGFYLGSGAALAIGAYVVSHFSGMDRIVLPFAGQVERWQAVFIVTGLPGVIIALLAYLLFDPRNPGASTAKAATQVGFLSFVRANRTILAISFCGFGLSSFVAYAIGAWAPTYYMRVHGMEAADIGPRYGFILALAAPGAIAGGILTDSLFRRGEKGSNYVVAGLGTVAATPFLILAFNASTAINSMTLLGIGMLCYGFTAPGPYSTFNRLAPPELRGRLMACFVLFHAFVGAGLAPVVVGLVTDAVFGDDMAVGRSLTIVLGVALPLMAALLYMAWRSERTPPADGGTNRDADSPLSAHIWANF
ncbi:MFS transporter [Sphingopyxis lindanitolerans]|uniref:MFS transporter n=2 Tax=Sphingopyxis lindanitolerans TaxID=2054227 RepID=A0A2S8B0W1_9SPHN|nr:MFS transporter [Sphingopyxis lindanitolerans]